MSRIALKQRLRLLTLLAPLALPGGALAQDSAAPVSAFSVTGSLTAISQYRLRGISVSDENPALQGGLTVSHNSGFYLGTWGSRLDGFGSFGGANMELDVFGGYATTVGDTTLDGGVIGYFFPRTNGHHYTEVYATVTHPFGPLTAKLGVNYAPKRKSIGNADNLYTYLDLALPLGDSPVTLKGHLGYTDGKGSIFSGPHGHYTDYSVGADIVWKALTFNLSYVGTDIGRKAADAYFSVPGGKHGHHLTEGSFVFSVTAAF